MATRRVPCHGIAIAPDGKSLWINSTVDNAVCLFAAEPAAPWPCLAASAREIENQPPISAIPNWITFTPDSDRLFVSNSALDSVSVIDAAVMKPIAVVPVGSVPKRLNTLVVR